jgi:hypothetical protein
MNGLRSRRAFCWDRVQNYVLQLLNCWRYGQFWFRVLNDLAEREVDGAALAWGEADCDAAYRATTVSM